MLEEEGILETLWFTSYELRKNKPSKKKPRFWSKFIPR